MNDDIISKFILTDQGKNMLAKQMSIAASEFPKIKSITIHRIKSMIRSLINGDLFLSKTVLLKLIGIK